ncbi:MAG: hemerythrin domain-containing protein [Planctomycetes bacterium]|nr:hemerythrin domain-containing protein [Planctomycetota bacterium]
MRPTEILMSEHRVIEQVLGCLEAMAEQAREEGVLDGEAARQALDFFKTFADRCHHGKEEKFLFPMMETKGFPRDGGPTGVMLHEHAIGREQIAGMAAALDEAARGKREAVKRFAKYARGYVDLLRQHIFKEDHVLFVMADRALNVVDQQTLMDSFTSVEEEDIGLGTHERFLALADDLAARFGVAHSATALGALPLCGSCGHHVAH